MTNKKVTEIPIFLKFYNKFLTKKECDSIIAISKDKFVKSQVYSSNNINTIVNNNVRSSSSYTITSKDPLFEKIKNKVSELLVIPKENFETLQVQKYEKGQQYYPHYDYIQGMENQRIKTFIIYLNRLKKIDGGCTSFTHYNYKIKPETGMAICFDNVDSNGNVNPKTMHAGELINTDAIKYILTIWIRQNKYV